jgi:hypothetical protein
MKSKYMFVVGVYRLDMSKPYLTDALTQSEGGSLSQFSQMSQGLGSSRFLTNARIISVGEIQDLKQVIMSILMVNTQH